MLIRQSRVYIYDANRDDGAVGMRRLDVQLGAVANFDDLVKFGNRRQIRRSQMFIV